MHNLRFFIEKKRDFAVESWHLFHKFKTELQIEALAGVRIINGYDIFDLDANDDEIATITKLVLAEAATDTLCCDFDPNAHNYFAIEAVDGQFDQRADSALQCIDIVLARSQNAQIKSFKIIVLEGNISSSDKEKIKSFYINPLDSKEKDLSIFAKSPVKVNDSLIIYDDFITISQEQLKALRTELGLSMSDDDFSFIQKHYQKLNRNPTETEIKVFDTYWSDHCRHSTFETHITDVSFPNSPYGELIKAAFADYMQLKSQVSPNKALTLMDMATIMAKYLRNNGQLESLEVSDENNACSVHIEVSTTDASGIKQREKYLLMFKNETHNHPTEIEPFGGASTCLGGAIRDPLSGRAYVYQAIRVTGSGNPLEKIEDTLAGKLSQRKITTEAALGYSSYGNQIGIATSLVSEIYHQGYKAKRMEVGAVVAAAPLENVVRGIPKAGDVIIMIGGKTGRDGCGGASGSSKEHTDTSLLLCGAEVQKGNAPEERKIQRLLRNKKASRLIKKCNDFGAGGVCVAIGELARGIRVNLNLIPVKYEGLSGTELAISESQERMALIIAANDAEQFLAYCAEENLLATVVGQVTDNNRLQLWWNDYPIVDIDRDFLDTNGVSQSIDIIVEKSATTLPFSRLIEGETLQEKWCNNLCDLNVASQKGLGEIFDATVGAGTILMPYGGKYQMTPIDVSVVKIPVLDKDTSTVSAISWGFNPALTQCSPYHGAAYAIIESLAKLVAAGIDYRRAHLSFQEYFQKLGQDKRAWSKPFLALLGAIKAQKDFSVAAIGGKDSMSGSFKDLTVPPTLISFAVATGEHSEIISPEFKHKKSFVYLIDNPLDADNWYDSDKLKANFDSVLQGIAHGSIVAASVIKQGGIAEALCKMSFGNRIGVKITNTKLDYFAMRPAAMVVESKKPLSLETALLIGTTIDDYAIINGDEPIDLMRLNQAWLEKFASIFPPRFDEKVEIYPDIKPVHYPIKRKSWKIARPKALIASFVGTNSEYDMYNAFQRNGAHTKITLFRNLTPQYIEQSINEMVLQLKDSQLFILPGGFSAGDEPDGSGKFIACILQNPRIADALNEFLHRDGLILGICNGFQALIKSGLLPNGEIGNLNAQSPTLSFNKIGRHISQMVDTKIVNNHSPWLSSYTSGQIFTIAVSHGEGRFYADKTALQSLIDRGQIATQYVNFEGKATNEFIHNPNGSTYAIEGITSPDGRIFGKMGHSERYSNGTFKNIIGDTDQNIFINGIRYFE